MMVSAALHSKREYIKGKAKKPKKMFRIPRDDEVDMRDTAGTKKRKEKEEDDVPTKNTPWCPATRADAWTDYPVGRLFFFSSFCHSHFATLLVDLADH